MLDNKDFRFNVSLSPEGYADKTISSAMIGSTKIKKNRQIRKQYGFKPNRGVGFMETSVTPQELLDAILEGKVFCHLFNVEPENRRKDGCFTSARKNNDNFLGSYVIGLDIDETSYPSVEEYVNVLSLKPTMYYTTYSNLQEGKGVRFRLIYVFDTLIRNPYFFRYCAWNLNRTVERDTGEVIKDNCNLNCSQYFNGTNKNNPHIHLDYGITGDICSLEDIGVSKTGFVDFLARYCFYKTVEKKRTREIQELLFELTQTSYTYNKEEMKFIPVYDTTTTVDVDQDYVSDYTLCSPPSEYSYSIKIILDDWDHLEIEDFMRSREWEYARNTTRYVYRKERPEWINGLYQFVDDDYFSLFYYPKTIRDNNHRRKKLFHRMCLRRVLCPEINKNEMIINTIIDIIKFFEKDDCLNSAFIKRNVDNCFEMDIDDIKYRYSDFIHHLIEVKRPKRGIIYKNKQAHSKETTYCILDDLYETSVSVSDNLDYINNVLNYKVSQPVLYRYLQDRGIKTDEHKMTDEEIIDLLDIDLSVRKNLKILKDSNIKIGSTRVNELLNRKRTLIQKLS